ncbi:MAG TPA: Gfo/Idh/MocA family oxidoreductase [Chthonomonas sp.]|jgi:predicted dehydrogenase|uniref:Gfo/Idh/MocA family protein n=1 Tax=Chthonomonas sp. TaxID=2282153 RepID=UPI002B4B14F6|nr:Gfo/Idh/MocA family oxidoreductase [Chthonomonas sp.]HLH81161.1 Gfo/Idh/MocA family oxidoreductase [Chthonomonas sp.]
MDFVVNVTTDTTPTRIGIIGCGNISDIYFEAGKRFRNLEIVACADLLMERAKEKAEKHGVPKALSVDQLLSDPDVEIVVNLTIPKAHAEVALAALEAGKHVYGEKPLAVSREQGRRMVSLARQKGLRIGCAPDTFLGGGHQTCRKLIDDGVIGEPVAASAFMLCHGHESWHPDPEFYYDKEGGGPLLDMGPYYLTALVNMIGGIRRVAGAARITFPERTITSQKKYGTKIVVGTPTHIASTLDFHTGAIATLVTSFDVWAHHMPNIEVYGTEGSLLVPDPNGFGGRVLVKRHDEPEWREVPLVYGYTGNARGLGVADMAAAIRSGRAHRASGDLAFHVLDVMLGILESSEQNRHYFPETTVDRPKALPLGLQDGEIDA